MLESVDDGLVAADSLATAWQQLGDSLVTAWRQLGNSLATAWQQLGDSLATACQQLHDRLFTTSVERQLITVQKQFFGQFSKALNSSLWSIVPSAIVTNPYMVAAKRISPMFSVSFLAQKP